MSDTSQTSCDTPELSTLSRTSSISAIPDSCLPAMSPSYGSCKFPLGSPRLNYRSSISSTSSLYTNFDPPNSSGSPHALHDSASDEDCKLIIRHVSPGVTHDELSRLIDGKMPYVGYGKPERGAGNEWTVKFSKTEVAERAKKLLHNLVFQEQVLKVHVSSSDPGAKVNSGDSATSTTSSSTTRGPTIVDGSVTG